MALTPEEAARRVPLWAGQGPHLTPLAGGLTNRNYRVDVGGQAFVLRLPGPGSELLGIDRRHERAAAEAAARAGLAPPVVYFLEPEGCLVTAFSAGRPVPPEAMRRPENLRRAAETLRRVHGLPPIPGAFSAFRVVADYDRLARGRGVDSFPADYASLRARLAEIEAALLRHPFTPCPCHNDLLNANFLDDGALRLLDWEYAGMGDPFFDLANFCANHELGEAEEALLLAEYFGAAGEARLARLRLMRAASDFREAMWGVAQQALGGLDFDYRAYADQHFDRLRARLADPGYGDWLGE